MSRRRETATDRLLERDKLRTHIQSLRSILRDLETDLSALEVQMIYEGELSAEDAE